MEDDWWKDPPDLQARRIASQLEHHSRRKWSAAGMPGSRWGAAQVCRVWPARILHVVGATEMADHLREIFSSGELTGWSLQPMPPTRTPLHSLLDALTAARPQPGSRRGYNQLDRHGFAYIEEIQVCPDEALLDINNLGHTTLTAIRDIVGPAPELPAQASEITLHGYGDADAAPERERHIVNSLSAAVAARNREFTRLLAQSRIPEAALDKICAALNNEPVPPADPLVMLLLDTAGETGLLRLYRSMRRDHSE